LGTVNEEQRKYVPRLLPFHASGARLGSALLQVFC
jgi:hypothetical protein